jgi:acetate---CoA ligase (ADP-forming)
VEEFPHALRNAIATELPPNAAVANPIDVAGAGEQDITCFTRVARHLVASQDIDAVVMTGYFGGFRDYSEELAVGEVQAARDIARAVADSGATYVSHTMFPESPAAQALREGGIAVYRNAETAAWALSRLGQWATREPCGVPPLHPVADAVTDTGYWSARMLLADAGVPFVNGAEVATREELHVAATTLRFPLVLKALGDEHKSDRGGVVLGICDQEHLERAWNDLQERLAPPMVSVEQMADLTDAVELIVGVRRSPSFGPIVLVGIGGVYTELLRDTRCSLGPVTPETARALLLSLNGAALLTGYRGKPAVDIDAAARLVSTMSHFAAAHPEISEVECNPVAVTPSGVTALDARIILAR